MSPFASQLLGLGTSVGSVAANDILSQLVSSTAQKRAQTEAQSAVEGRRREMQQQGMIPYTPAQPALANDAARTAAARSGLPQPATFAEVETVQQRPTGGTIINYPTGERIVMSRFGTGTATKGKKGPTMIEGKPAAEYFAETAARQGQSNKFAAAVPTGFKDMLGRPKYTGVSLVEEAMSKKKV